MVDITPGRGLRFVRAGTARNISLGDSISRVISLLQDNLSVFGTIKLVAPRFEKIAKKERNAAQGDIWIFLLQSGLKFRFDGACQKLQQMEVFLVSSSSSSNFNSRESTNALTKRV